jgi:hypothetical protein
MTPELMIKNIGDAIEYNGNEVVLNDVLEGIHKGEFLVVNGQLSTIVLEPVEFPSGKRVMNFFLAGGDLDELRELEQNICRLAKQDGYTSMSIFGRKGWLRRLDGYKAKAVYMEKEL